MTEMYDGDHDISDLDRARSEAMQAGEASGNRWAGAPRFESMMEELQEHIHELLESLIVSLATLLRRQRWPSGWVVLRLSCWLCLNLPVLACRALDTSLPLD
eukprot:m.96276 g.96276  ORF g.96276 m.96276 type:complete len:102 (-) comp12357_c1_seq2:479-784(-)